MLTVRLIKYEAPPTSWMMGLLGSAVTIGSRWRHKLLLLQPDRRLITRRSQVRAVVQTVSGRRPMERSDMSRSAAKTCVANLAPETLC